MSCCSSTVNTNTQTDNPIAQAYGTLARNAGADQTYADSVAAAFGYTNEELKSIPAEANLGLSCGNPTAVSKLKEGERVLDLGSGGGIDILLAAPKVGEKGQAIGLDLSPDMVALARKNAYSKGYKPPHVVFVLASLDQELPLESNSIDCVISNCVINLLSSNGKASVFKEVARVLKPGGRIVLDDIVAKKEMPESITEDVNAGISCVSGAVTEDEYRSLLVAAGLEEVLFVDRKADMNAYWKEDKVGFDTECCKPGEHTTMSAQRLHKPNVDVNEWIASYQIYALKPQDKTLPSALPHLESALKRHWDAYPTVKSAPPSLTNEEVAKMMLKAPLAQRDFVVIDVRRNDHGGGHIRDSEQWAAQTFYDRRRELFEKHPDKKKVIFYCGSSNGRGPRCAGWYQDYLDEVGDECGQQKAWVLQGGIKAWLAKFQGREDLIDWDKL